LKKLTQNIVGIIVLLIFQSSIGQERIITGKVVGQDLTEFPGVIIMTSNLKAIDTTDFNGNFNFKFSKNTQKIMLVFPMTQLEEIEITKNCNRIEIILFEEWIYDFVSLKRAKRKKERDRKRILPKLYTKAYEKGIFKNEKSCRKHGV
jgi:hypothetical protein